MKLGFLPFQVKLAWSGVLAGCCFVLLFVTIVFAIGASVTRAQQVVGIETTAVRIPNSPLVTLRAAFRNGSVNDPVGKNGLNAVTALMMGRGGTQSMTYEEITQALYPWSAIIDVQFDKEMTVIVGEVHRDHVETFYPIFRDLIVAPRFEPSDFSRNREFLVNAVTSTLRGTDDEELGKQALNSLLYEGHPYGTPAQGTENGLRSVTLNDVRGFHAAYFTVENLMLGIAGGYSEGFAEEVERDLSTLLHRRERVPLSLPQPREIDGIEVLLVEKEAIATAISIGFPIEVTRRHDDFFALMVANSYLGEHRTFNGLLMQKMRGDRGLNYGDYSYIENFIQDGGSRFPIPNIPRSQQYFSIWIRPVPHHNAHFALHQAIRELTLLVDDGLSQEAFEASREFLLNYSKLYVQTTSRRLGYLLDSRFYGYRDFLEEIQDRLPRLTVDEVNAAIRRHLQYDNLGIAIVTSDAEEFGGVLLGNAPSAPSYGGAVTDAILAEDKAILSYELEIDPYDIEVVPVDTMFERSSWTGVLN